MGSRYLWSISGSGFEQQEKDERLCVVDDEIRRTFSA